MGGVGEADTGYIKMTDEAPVEVENYSKYTTLIYEHETAAPADPNTGLTIKGGDFRIGKAAAGSGITLRTDNAGLNTASTKAADKNLVSGTLNKLANKLYYTAYKDGEKNLTGKVEIAEGLTAQSASRRIENITYKDADGQGQYLYTPAVDNVNYKNTPITGDLSAGADPSQQVYKNAGILQPDGVYKFTTDDTLTATEYANVVNAKDNVIIDAAGKVLTMNQEGRKKDTAIINDVAGKTVTITAKKLVLDTGLIEKNRAAGFYVRNEKADGGQNVVTVNGDLDVTATSKKNTGMGIYAAGDSIVTINGNFTMKKDNGWAADGKGFTFYGVSAIFSTSPWGEYNKGAIVNVNGDVDFKVNGNGAFANIGDGEINLNGGGKIEVNKANKMGYGALVAQCGTVNMNVVKDGSGNVTGAGNKDVNIKGNVSAKTGAIHPFDKGIYSTVNLGLNTTKSTLEGVVWNGFDKKGNYNPEYSEQKMFYGRVNLWLANGATWTNAAWGIPGENYYGTTADKKFHGSNPTNLYGGSDAAHAGVIIQKDKNPISVENYSGNTMVIYEHDTAVPADPNEGLSMKGGDFKIEKAAANSGITLRTDNEGLNTASTKAADKNLVSGTLNKLANKLYYTAYKDGEKNLSGKVEIAEGLTAQSASKRIENMTYKDANGQGQYLYEPAVDEPTPPTPPTPPIIHGDKETVMMRGSKSAMTAAALLWRSNNNDLQRRMGDVRLGKEENGIWARYLGGKNKLDQQKAYFKQTYNIAQVGYDKKVGDWLVGAALDYGTGNDTYATGTGKEKLGSLALYGTRQSKDGQYVDLIVRGSQVKNDYTVYNEMHHKLDGNYKTWGLSFSAEYGKRFVQANGFYFDPSLELTAGHLNGKDYDAVSDYAGGKKMHVQQDGINSVIGRLGLGIGCETETSNLFAKVALAHEFGGTIRSTFSAAGEPTSSTEVDLKDTWVDLELGGSWQMNKDTYLYGTYTRNFGADLSNKWRVDAGVRFSF